MLVLPFTSDYPRYDFSTTVDEVDYEIAVHWNDRDAAWYFDVAAADGTEIATGVKVVLGVALGGWVDHPLFRAGMIRAIDTAGTKVDAGRYDLGTRVQVVRYRLDEVVAILATAGTAA